MVDVEHVSVIGGGVMGSGIGQAFLQNGYDVSIRDIEQEILQETEERIVDGNYGLNRAVESDHLSEEEKQAALDRLTLTTDLGEAVADADFVLEAVSEDLELKGRVFREIDSVTGDTPLYSNTSGFSATSLSNALEDPSRFAVAHFFNPAQIMTLVEIVPTGQTDDEVVDTIVEVSERMGKTAIVLEDAPGDYGFVANRCYAAMRREAERIVEEGVATEKQVDTALEEGYNLPVGPFSLRGIGEEWD
ncbi:3-hydroxyacyl-CoA dehydrogenase family protein [Halomarina litorea]|uniref:3-hydroxyacyl-CoA dehydrogenase family protein n=1 Tax=Halomarina litorea TaxID=2961595 RepID=UPI0020C408D9|nr:3-hydroxyacyl-CoA dehydrogenase family protein [Halomarina sp. BCD28]